MEFCDEVRVANAFKKVDDRLKALEEAINIVRCKDCRWCKRLESATGNYSLPVCGYKNAHGMVVNETGYCAWGEHKEGADDV